MERDWRNFLLGMKVLFKKNETNSETVNRAKFSGTDGDL